jgi:hypothetical protein
MQTSAPQAKCAANQTEAGAWKSEADRVSGWSALLQRLGDPEAGILPKLLIHKRCPHLLECLPFVQPDPERPKDVLKTNPKEEGREPETAPQGKAGR